MEQTEQQYEDQKAEARIEERERNKDRAGIGSLDLGEGNLKQMVITAAGEMEYDLVCPNSKRAIKEAEIYGLDVVFPKADQLQLDLDTAADYALYQGIRDVISHHYGIEEEEIHTSRSGGEKQHLTVTLSREISNTERIALQACLGSDRKRELLSLIQEINQDPHPVLFLEVKGAPNTPKQLTEGTSGE